MSKRVLILMVLILIMSTGCSSSLATDGNYNGVCKPYDCRVQYGTLNLDFGYHRLFCYETMEYTRLCAIPGCTHQGVNCPANGKAGREFVRYGKHYWLCNDEKMENGKIAYYMKLKCCDVSGENEYTVCTVKDYKLSEYNDEFLLDGDMLYIIACMKGDDKTDNRICSFNLLNGSFKEICSVGDNYMGSLMGLFDGKIVLSTDICFDRNTNSFCKNEHISSNAISVIREGYYGYYDGADFVVLRENKPEIRITDVATTDINRDFCISIFDNRLFVYVNPEKPYYIKLDGDKNEKVYFDAGVDFSKYKYPRVYDEYKDNLILLAVSDIDETEQPDDNYNLVDSIPMFFKIPKAKIYEGEVS